MKAPRWLQRLLDGWACALGNHRWHWHPTVRDWFCERCRKRRPTLGVRK